MLTARYIIGFTGHRAGIEEDVIHPVLLKVLMELQKKAAAAGGRAELYSGIAEGADTLCVEIARSLDMPVHLILPLEETEFEKDFTDAARWERSLAQIRDARSRSTRDSVHLSPGETVRPDCYFNQAMHMLSASDVLVAVRNGQPAAGMGGTQEVLEQARAAGIPVVEIDADSGAVTESGDLERRFSPDEITGEINSLAVAGGGACAGLEQAGPDALQGCLDRIAVEEVGRFRPSLVRIILLHGVAALLAALVTFQKGVLPWFDSLRWAVTAIELVLVSWALWLGVHLHRRHTQERWIRCRFACELVRGLRASVPLLDPLHPPVARHDLEWRRFAVSAGLLVVEHQTDTPPETLRDAYVATRLSETHPEGQIRHYLSMQPPAARWRAITDQVGSWGARLAPAFVLLSLLNKLLHWDINDRPAGWILVVFLPIALPLIAGTAGGIRQALDAGRRGRRYGHMVRRLREIRAWMPGLRTTSSIQSAVLHSEEMLLDELLEWQLSARNTGH